MTKTPQTARWERPTPYFQRGDYVLSSHYGEVTVLEDGYKPTVRTSAGKVVQGATGLTHGTVSQLVREGQIPPARPLVDWIDPVSGETFHTYAVDASARAAGCVPLTEYAGAQ